MQIKQRKPESLKPYEKNPRVNDHAVDAVARSIEEFGFSQPVVVDKHDVIVVGHTRWKAARKLGLKTIPVIKATWLSPEQCQAYRIADNQTAAIAGWEYDLLRGELTDLFDKDFDLGKLGFDDDQLARAMEPPSPEIVQDEVPEPPAKPKTKPGDLIILGRHRLVCGDAENADDVKRLLGTRKPFLMVTDPPYGVKYDPEWRLRTGLNKEHQTRAEGKVTNDDKVDWTKAWQLSPATVAYVWHSAIYGSTVAANLIAAKFAIRSQIIWRKSSLVIGRGHYHWQHEPCWYAARGSAKWCGDRKQSTIWDVPNMHRTQGNVDDGHTAHSTQKPVECMARPIRNHGTAKDQVYDPFVGSGTTIIAAEQLGRAVFAMELDPAYCDVTVERWQNLTGKKAKRESA